MTLLDRSEAALALALEAAQRNGVADRVEMQKAEALEALERMVGAGKRFGVVITDPPAFAKARKDQQAQLVLKELKELKDLQDLKDLLALKGRKDLLVRKETKVFKVRQVRKVLQVHRD